ncbi:hypothetical protein G7Z17_g2667 [Cylindrodendrum hubeiense]|uniref:WD-like domain-containing protein n=1 Tax=Cylindrodendrum hubeiense TaxID=595255 RepID=A0A9P5HH61_9HYPO|nr:hypothetical protein G7Z17_g2667 [Cylindrodendrum hubeiense]
MKARLNQLVTSVVTTAAVMTLFKKFPLAQAMPTTETGLHARNVFVDDFENIYISNVTDKIFGQDSTKFDYIVIRSEKDLAISATNQYAAAWTAGRDDETFVAFINATMAGHMEEDQASDISWLCGELDNAMLPHVSKCANVKKRDMAVALEARSRWSWSTSKSHVATDIAVRGLGSFLSHMAWHTFPLEPRSVCTNGACLSWSKPLTAFTNNFAQLLVDDALTAVDFNNFSAEAYRGINGVDICISNRASGCN